MAKEYIEREAAVDALNKALFFYEDETEARFKNDPDLDISEWFFHRIFVQHMNEKDRQTVLDIPAADVRPVVRGRWIGIDDEPHETWECDHCGKIVEHEQCSLPNFCDECGADMREVDDAAD